MASSLLPTTRTSLSSSEANVEIEKANAIISAFGKAPLAITRAQGDFENKLSELSDNDPGTSITPRQIPAHIATEVEAQLSFLRKLKFNYLEQSAKDKYIKTIVDDEAEIITVDDNEALRRGNEEKKARLKEAKDSLAMRNDQVHELALDVEQKYKAAERLRDEISRLSSEILDSRLAISRLRTTYPPDSRLSVASANSKLEEQTEQMAAYDVQVSENATRTERMKEQVQDAMREVERLRVERSAKEEEARQTRGEEEDERVGALYEWYTALIAMHRSLFSLTSTKLVAENELELSYEVPVATSRNPRPVPFTLTLLFQPNTRVLADAAVSSPSPLISNLDLDDVIGINVQANDASSSQKFPLLSVYYINIGYFVRSVAAPLIFFFNPVKLTLNFYCYL
ncbi:hypothetical protein PNOK_0981000 [Pyrrhoderma noxium]|uniref:Kinetochore protein Sos7 coiled-coil domain-containing protein n=1 Tax=Pyrrhoderma noxium TaxID=2282107 RepID=A0A286U5B2_9AGAM|nr:hypothetical protein PNOK_0981000 [Pyrrhoderma noxium]